MKEPTVAENYQNLPKKENLIPGLDTFDISILPAQTQKEIKRYKETISSAKGKINEERLKKITEDPLSFFQKELRGLSIQKPTEEIKKGINRVKKIIAALEKTKFQPASDKKPDARKKISNEDLKSALQGLLDEQNKNNTLQEEKAELNNQPAAVSTLASPEENKTKKLQSKKLTFAEVLDKMATIIPMETKAGEYLSNRETTARETTAEEAEVAQTIENLAEEEKEKLVWGLSTLGFKVEQNKNEFFAKIFSAGKKEQKGTMARFTTQLAKGFERDAKAALKKGLEVQEGKSKARVKNATFLVGNVLKYGRTISDIVGNSVASPLRYVMMTAMAFTRASEAGKEARLSNEEVIEQTRIQDAELAAEEAWKIYEKAQKSGGQVSADALKKAYMQEIPADLQKRLEVPSAANGAIQWVVKKDISMAINRLNKNILEIEKNKKLTEEEKELEKSKLIEGWEKSLADYDRIVTQYGTVDALAMAGRYAQTAGKAVVAGLAVETLALSAERLWGSISHLITSHQSAAEVAEKVASSSGIKHAPATTPTENFPGGHKDVSEIIKSSPGVKSNLTNRYDTTVFEGEDNPNNLPSSTHHIEEVIKSSPGVHGESGSGYANRYDTKVFEELNGVKHEAVIGKGEGVEHAFRRQIEHNEALAKALNWDGKEDLHKFSAGAAHRMAIDHGYVDGKTGEEIWVRSGNTPVAYQAEVGADGQVKIHELNASTGQELDEVHGKGYEFEKDTEKYEFKHGAKIIKEPGVEKTAEVVKTDPEITSSNSAPNQQIAEALRKLGFTGDPTDQKAVEEFLASRKGASLETHTEAVAQAKEKVLEKMIPKNSIKVGTTAQTGTERDIGSGGPHTQENYIPGSRPAGQNISYNTNTYWTGNRAPYGYNYENQYGGRPEGGDNIYGYGRSHGGGFYSERDAIIANKNDGTIGTIYSMSNHYFPDISPEANATLDHYPLFEKNPYELSGQNLFKALESYRLYLNKIFPEKTNEAWGIIRGTSAKKMIDSDSEILQPPMSTFVSNIQKLSRITGLEPDKNVPGRGLFGIFRRKPETMDEYLSRALQRASQMGRLQEVEPVIEK